MGREITITLDEETAAKLDAEAKRTGQETPEFVDAAVRQLVKSLPVPTSRKPFELRAFHIGLRPELNLDCTGRLLEELDQIEELERQETQ